MKRTTTSGSMQAFVVRALSFTAITAFTLNPALTPVLAADARANIGAPMSSDGQMGARFLSLGIGKSIVIDLPRDIKDVLVANPKIANAVVPTAQRAYIIGAAVGQTNIVFFDSTGQQIAAYDIAVTRDLNGVRAALKQAMPTADLRIEGVGDGVMLSGSVSSPIEAQQAGDIATRLVGGADKVVNSIIVRGRDQVLLKVTVAEVTRSIVKQLGIDLTANLAYGTSAVTFTNANAFTALGRTLNDNSVVTKFGGGTVPSVQATLKAMESAGVVRTLAEPNLTAISGESATFLAGGEFPIPTGVTCQTTAAGSVGQCAPSIAFKKFGISLHTGGDVGRPHQPAGDDRSVGSLDRQLDHHQRSHGALDQGAPRRDHAGNSLGRRDGDGRVDPGTDQAGGQRPARAFHPAGARHAVSQPRLRQQPDRADGDRDADDRPRRRAEGPVASG
jgi:pilus assembly protein CpaC